MRRDDIEGLEWLLDRASVARKAFLRAGPDQDLNALRAFAEARLSEFHRHFCADAPELLHLALVGLDAEAEIARLRALLAATGVDADAPKGDAT